jgi:LPXTG-site transpeptidase (sortase) family protein
MKQFLVLAFIFILTCAIVVITLNWQALSQNASFTLRTFFSQNAKAYFLPLAENKKETPFTNIATLRIDAIGVNAPIIFNTGNNTDVIFKSLEQGVVHYSQTTKPGTPGVSLLLGHSSSYPWYKGHYGSVFALLPKLKTGDVISVQYSDGRLFSYKVTKSIIFNPFDAQDILTKPDIENGIILVSCWPVGTSLKRLAIEAVAL